MSRSICQQNIISEEKLWCHEGFVVVERKDFLLSHVSCYVLAWERFVYVSLLRHVTLYVNVELYLSS